MATVTGLTAPRMLEIEANSVVDGTVDENGHLKLTTHGGETIDAGKVKGDKGEPGGVGPAGPVSPPNPEPIPVSTLSVTSNTAFYTAAGQPVSTVVFAWPVPGFDIVGNVPTIDGYELWYRRPTDTNSVLLASVGTNEASVTTMEPGVAYKVKGRAHSLYGQWGAFSSEINVTPVVPSNSVPNEPDAVTIVSNVGTYRSDGRAEAVVKLMWEAVTQTVEGDPIGIRTYEIWLTVDGATSPVLQTPETSVYLRLPSGVTINLKVKAMSNYGIWGDFSESDVVTTAFPPPNNNPPTTPSLTTNKGVVYATWDGNLSTGPVGPEFQHLITEVATSSSGPWTTFGIPSVSAGPSATIPSSPGMDIWVRYRWRDKLGRLSTGISPVASITTIGIEQADLSPDLSDVIDSLENAVVSVITEYAVNSSETVPPSSGWSTDTPARTPGTFVWMRVTTNYADETSSIANPVLVTGNTGASGSTGAPGKGISSTAVTYQVHSNGTTAPTGTWVASPPATSSGQFLWTRTITTYTDATTTTAYSVAAHGATGSTGAAGKGITSSAITYQAHTNGTTAPTGTWVASPPSVPSGQYLWTRTIITYTDASTSTSYSVSRQGADGSTGTPGAPGVDGQTSYFHVAYATNSTGTAGFSTSDPSGKTYMGTYTDFTPADSSNPALYEWVKIEGPVGSTGPTGKGIASSSVHYQASASGTVVPTGTWVTSPPAVSEGQYLWTRTTITFTDAATQVAYSAAKQGETGPQGVPGTPGADGMSRYTWIKYADTPTTGMSDSPTGKTYMGIAYNKTSATESSVYADYEWSLIKGAQGIQGPPGDDGQPTYTWIKYGTSSAGAGISDSPTGKTYMGIAYNKTTATESSNPTDYEWSLIQGEAGRGISSTAVTYQVHTNGTTAPTGTWQASPQVTSTGQFLWTRTITTYTDATTSTAYSVAAHGATGSQGIQGPPGTNGQPTYTWIKYADTPTTGMNDSPTGKTYMGIAYNKLTATESSTYSDYEWSLIKGADGVDGKGISSTAVTYQVHSNGTTAPTGSWLASPPATTPGQFLWTRTITTYTDASNTTAYSVAVHGATGATGSTGAAGKGISSTAVTYQVHSNGTTAPTGTWQTSPQATTPGQFLWTRTITTYTDATTTTAYAVAAHGAQGSQGIQGPPGVDGQPTYTWIKYGTSAAGAGMSDDPTGKTYMGIAYNKTTATESSNPADYEWSLIQGPQGNTGAAGKGIASTAVTYQVHSNGTTAPTGTWVSSPPATSTGQFLWTRTILTYTDATTSTVYGVSAHGATGSTGAAGTDATTIIVGNDAVAIPTNPSGSTTSSHVLTIPFSGWIGNSRAAATVAVSGLPTGITVGTNTAATTSADGTLTLNVANASTLGGGTNGEITLTITCNSKTFVRKFSWTKAPQGATGSTGSTGSAGVSATSIDVGNEAAVIPCTNAGATVGASTITIPFTGFIGSARAATTVAVSGLPTGITVQTNTAGTTGSAGSLVLAVASASTLGGAASGNITLTITCNSITFVQLFSWSKAVAGSNGSTGATGTDATNVVVGNDAIALQTNTSGLIIGSYNVEVPFSGWVGASRAAASVAVTGLPVGITVDSNTAATTGANGLLVLAVADASNLGGSNRGEITLTISCNFKSFTKILSWTKVRQGTTGSTGSTGAAATSIDVGNEAAVIPCTSAGATVGASTITIPFTGFIGNARAAATVAVSGLPTGITVQTNTAGTTGAAGSLVLAVASASTLGGVTSGNITLTITCNSIAFVQFFSWSKAVAGATGSTGSAGKGVSSVTPYYLQQGTGVAAPNAPTTNPPGGSWSITEPGYVSSTELYRAELFVFTDATFGWTTVSKVSAYTASTQAMTAANLADAAAHGMVKASQTDPGQSAGRIWLVLNASNQVIGVKISNGSAWTSYVLMADQILVPSSVGTVSIADGAVNASKVNATSIWADEGWLNVLRVGVIEASMVTSDFESELTLESNHAINVIVTQQEELTTNLDTVQEDLETTSEILTELSDELGTVSGVADNAMTAAGAADTLAKQNQIALTETQLWFRVDGSGAHVGRTDSAFQTHIFPGKLSITDNGVETTWWEANRMVVPILEATSQIVIARHQLEPFPSVNPTGTVIRSVS